MLPRNSDSTATSEGNPVRMEGQSLPPDRPNVQQESTNSATTTDLHYSIWRGFTILNGGVGYGYDRVFVKCLDEKLTSVRVEDPYIRSDFQVQNFFRFCKLLNQKCRNLKRITLITKNQGRRYEEKIKRKVQPTLGDKLHFEYKEGLHDRKIDFDNGWRVILGHGLDYFDKLANPSFGDTDDMNHRACKDTIITILRDETNVNADKESREIDRAWDREGRLLGEYTERTEIRRGGVGVVFKARHKIDKGWYAIKQVDPVDPVDAVDVADTEKSPNKVLREVHILAKLDHSYIVRYYDAWLERPPSDEKLWWMDSNQPCLYIRMEWCSGSTLHEWLEQNRLLEQRLTEQTLDWFRQLISAVKYIHDKKVIHRDIKPGNIFFGSSRDGAASALKIGGFGVATYVAASSSSGVSGDTSKNLSIVGTEIYMSPEQPSGHYKNSTDIFSLGLVFLEMVHPFESDRERRGAFGALRANQHPKVMDKLDEKMDTLISRMTTFEPKKRPTASELNNELKKKRGETNANVGSHHQFEILDGSAGYGYDRVFGDCLDEESTSVRVEDPWICEKHQVQNFILFCILLVQKCDNLKTITLITSPKSQRNEKDIKNELDPTLTKRGIKLDFDYDKNLHDRKIDFGNGWTVIPGRGLDYFKKPANWPPGGDRDMNIRPCRKTTITIFRGETNVNAGLRHQSKMPADSMSSHEESKKRAKQLSESAKEIGAGPHAETTDGTDSNVKSEVGTSSTYPNESVCDNEAAAETRAEATSHVGDLGLSPDSTVDVQKLCASLESSSLSDQTQ